MNRKDLYMVSIVGAAVGILSQPILGNILGATQEKLLLPLGALRPIIFIFFLVLAPVALWVASLVGKKFPTIYQFAKFAAVGTLNSFVDLGVFNLETLILGHQPTSTAFAMLKGISFLVATTNSFFWNKYWTFESKEKADAKQVGSFYGIAIAGFFLNVGVATLVFQAGKNLSVSPTLWTNVVSPVAGILGAFVWNFVGYKFFVFNRTR